MGRLNEFLLLEAEEAARLTLSQQRHLSWTLLDMEESLISSGLAVADKEVTTRRGVSKTIFWKR